MRNFLAKLVMSLMVLSTSVLAVSVPPLAGKDYKVLDPVMPVLSHSLNKVEVIEFFWYGCPHCYDLEPLIEPWLKKQPSDKVFVQRVPVAFDNRVLGHSKLYYALETMGRLDLHQKFFHTFHAENKHLIQDKELVDWAVAQGLDRTQFTKIFNSFSVTSKVQAANKMAQDYHLDGVPTIVIAGKYITSPAFSGSNERTMEVVDWLVRQTMMELHPAEKKRPKNK